jgi:hypothetical protein
LLPARTQSPACVAVDFALDGASVAEPAASAKPEKMSQPGTANRGTEPASFYAKRIAPLVFDRWRNRNGHCIAIAQFRKRFRIFDSRIA